MEIDREDIIFYSIIVLAIASIALFLLMLCEAKIW